MKQREMRNTDAAIVYAGPSKLDPAVRILGIVTGLKRASKNPKTGTLAQLWIIRADMDPLTAIASGGDSAICGDCGLRGNGHGKDRGCYVAVKNAPLAVFHRSERNGYPRIAPRVVASILRIRNRGIRIGAYGDPAALPVKVVQSLTRDINGHTGYTHAWRQRPDLAPFVMASVDSPSDYLDAKSHGWRTFRTRAAEQPLESTEISCPASDEAGHRTTCEHCTLCDGKRFGIDSRRDIAILAHGATTASALRFIRSKASIRSDGFGVLHGVQQ